MPVKVFISATSYDMEECRPAAYKAIEEYGKGVAITMENWVTEYKPAPEVCHTQLKEHSSHYVGIFGYRYGWIPGADGALIPAEDCVPDAIQKSITELEYHWARHYKKPMAVLMPARGSEIDLDLKQRADQPNPQKPEDTAAVKAFHRLVKNEATIMPFPSVLDMALQIQRIVTKWQNDGLRGIAREAETQSRNPQARQTILKLGRETQTRQFKDWLDELDASDLTRAVCFVVHAENSEIGTDEAIKRLTMEYEELSNSDIKRITFNVEVLWQEQGLSNMLRIIGNQIENGWEPADINELSARISQILESSDMLLTILDAQRLQDGLVTFQQQFWIPLVAALPDGLAHQLLALVEHERPITCTDYDFICDDDALENFDEDFQTNNLILLPELQSFTEKEIRSWLRRQMNLSPADAKIQSTTLFNETNGKPQSLFIKLNDLF
ncbi:MAG: DUF4062 domain-containing protein [Calditrichia bacterium]